MDELGQVRLRDPDVPADLVKRDPPLRDQPADEPLGRVQVLVSLLDRVQPVHCAPPAGSGVSQTHAADGTSPGSTQRVPKRIATRRNARIPNTPKDPRTITYGGFGPCRATPSLQGSGWPGPDLASSQLTVCLRRVVLCGPWVMRAALVNGHAREMRLPRHGPASGVVAAGLRGGRTKDTLGNGRGSCGV